METDMDLGGSSVHGGDGPCPCGDARRLAADAGGLYQACLVPLPHDPDMNHPESTAPAPHEQPDGASTALATAPRASHLTAEANILAMRLVFQGTRATGVMVERWGAVYRCR